MDTNEQEMLETILRHKALVGTYMRAVIAELTQRAVEHDYSKFGSEEFSAYAATLPKFKEAEYGTPEYQACLDAIQPAIQHHYKANRHHPEFYQYGIYGMTLIDLIEMVCDWIAAAKSTGGELRLDVQQDRFGIDEFLFAIIARTVEELTDVKGQ